MVYALLFLLLFQMAGWILLWQMAQSNARQQAAWQMAKDVNSLEHIQLSKDALAAARVGRKEIRIDGRMYDIHSQRFFADSVHLLVYRDHAEESILKRIGSYFSSKDSQSGALFQGLWSKWAGWAYLVPLVPMLEMPKVAEICPLQIGHINRPEIPSLDHPAPPPKQQYFATFGFFRPI